MKRAAVIGAVLAASLIAASSGTAANSPVPQPGSSGCHGQFMAISNHSSGAYGASGNEMASAGAGYFLGSMTHDVVGGAVDGYCG